MRHPNVNPDKVLGKPAGSRCRSTIIGRDIPQYFLPPDITLDRRSHVEPQQRPMTPPLPEVATVNIPSPAMSFMADYFPVEYTELTNTKRKHKEARTLEFLGSTDTDVTSAFSFKECGQSVNVLDISIPGDQLWSVHAIL